MIIGIPKEIKDKEFRVGMVPAGVHDLITKGHEILVESGAGIGSGIADDEYRTAGAKLIDEGKDIYRESELVVKVKEPLEKEYRHLRKGLILFTYLHLASMPELTQLLLDNEVAAIAYETVSYDNEFLPLLAPMSEIAGRMSIQVGAHFLEKEAGGRGVLLGGVTGVKPGQVVILGSGTVGTNCAEMAVGLGAAVTILGRNPDRLAALEKNFSGRIRTMLSSRENIFTSISTADLVVGAVLVPGAAAPKLITRDMLSQMQEGTVIVDVSIDQGGCVETARPTTHSDPVYKVDGITHYCVANMPGAVPRTSTFALTNATLPFVLMLAENGLQQALQQDDALRRGLNTYQGHLTNREVAQAQNREYKNLAGLLTS